MKKMLSVLLVLAMAACLTVSAFAADSPTTADAMWGAAGADGASLDFGSFTISLAPGAFLDVLYGALTEAPGLADAEGMLDVLQVQEIDVDKLPDTFTIAPNGAAFGAGTKLYAFATFNGSDSNWVLVGTDEDGDGKIEVDVAAIKANAPAGSKIQIAVSTLSASGATGSGSGIWVSPKTGIATVTYVAMSIVATACPAAAIVSHKKKEA